VPPQKNFLKLNEMGIVYKAIRPRDVKEFRKNHDARMAVRRGQFGIPIVLPDINFRYGHHNK
jgi:hypothetical protein